MAALSLTSQAFREVGLKSQRRRREYLRILKSVEVRDGDKFIGVYPGDGYSVSYQIDFPPPIGKQGYIVDLATERLRASDRPGPYLRLARRRAEASRHGPDPRRVAKRA